MVKPLKSAEVVFDSASFFDVYVPHKSKRTTQESSRTSSLCQILLDELRHSLINCFLRFLPVFTLNFFVSNYRVFTFRINGKIQ